MKPNNLKRFILILLISTLTMSLTACGQSSKTSVEDNSLHKIIASGQFVLGLDNAFPPMGFADENGQTVGFDVDVAQEVCNRLGVQLILQPIDWDKKMDELNEGRIDCIWNGLSVTPEREEEMCLTKSYMRNELIVVVPEDSEIMGMNDLSGITIGVQSGATSQEVLEASDIYSQIEVEAYDTAMELLDALQADCIDAALVDSVVAYYFIFSSTDTYYILPESLGEEEYAVGFRKTDQALCDKVQEIISEMKSDGTLGEISKVWFGSDITIVR